MHHSSLTPQIHDSWSNMERKGQTIDLNCRKITNHTRRQWRKQQQENKINKTSFRPVSWQQHTINICFGSPSWPPTSILGYFIQCTQNQGRYKKMNKNLRKYEKSVLKIEKVWETVLKAEKVWESVLKVEKVWESVPKLVKVWKTVPQNGLNPLKLWL